MWILWMLLVLVGFVQIVGADNLEKAIADVQQRSKRGEYGELRMTPLHVAARENAHEVVVALLEGGADIEATNSDGDTPLHQAALGKAREAASELIARGANVNATDNYGHTPLHVAAWQNAHEIAAELIRHGSDVKARDRRRLVPWEHAYYNEAHETMDVLEAERQRQLEAKRQQREAEGRRREAEQRRQFEAERQQREAERQRWKAEWQRREAEQQRQTEARRRQFEAERQQREAAKAVACAEHAEYKASLKEKPGGDVPRFTMLDIEQWENWMRANYPIRFAKYTNRITLLIDCEAQAYEAQGREMDSVLELLDNAGVFAFIVQTEEWDHYIDWLAVQRR